MLKAAKKRGLAGVCRRGEDFTELLPLDKNWGVLDGGYILSMHPRRGVGHPPCRGRTRARDTTRESRTHTRRDQHRALKYNSYCAKENASRAHGGNSLHVNHLRGFLRRSLRRIHQRDDQRWRDCVAAIGQLVGLRVFVP